MKQENTGAAANLPAASPAQPTEPSSSPAAPSSAVHSAGPVDSIEPEETSRDGVAETPIQTVADAPEEPQEEKGLSKLKLLSAKLCTEGIDAQVLQLAMQSQMLETAQICSIIAGHKPCQKQRYQCLCRQGPKAKCVMWSSPRISSRYWQNIFLRVLLALLCSLNLSHRVQHNSLRSSPHLGTRLCVLLVLTLCAVLPV